MKHIDVKLNLLKENLLDMAHIVKIQVQKSRQALFLYDLDLAMEVVENNKRIDILKQQVIFDCRDILALYTPVAIDLRLILSSIKIANSLEEIGNQTKDICLTVKELEGAVATEMLEFFKLNKLFDKVINMLYKIHKALEEHNAHLAGKTFNKDRSINKINKKSKGKAIAWIDAHPQGIAEVLHLLNIIADVEHIGDQVKNISDGIVYYKEAKVIRHLKI